MKQDTFVYSRRWKDRCVWWRLQNERVEAAYSRDEAANLQRDLSSSKQRPFGRRKDDQPKA